MVDFHPDSMINPDLQHAARSAERKTPLRIGVVVDSPRVPAWVAQVVERLRSAAFTELALAILVDEPKSLRRRLSSLNPGGVLFRLYERLDAWFFRDKNDVWACVDVSDLCDKIPTARFATESPGRGQSLPEADMKRIAGARLDILLDLSSSNIGDDLAEAAGYGVWRCHPGEARVYEVLPPLVQEMYDQNPVAATVLQFQTERRGAAKVLCRGTFAADRNSLSKTRNISARNAAGYVLRRLDDLHQYGWDHFVALEGFGEPDTYVKDAVRIPGSVATLRLVARLATRLLRRRMHAWRFDTPWLIAYRLKDASAAPGAKQRETLLSFPETDHFYADPFPFRRDGRDFLFFEDYRCDRRRGVIAVVEIDGEGRVTKPRTVLETDYHLSYPFLFEWQGEAYLLPETSEHETIELYRAVEFPHRWVLDRIVMDGVRAVDSTIFPLGDLFWLFTSIAAPSGELGQELSLFYADTPLGPWTPHPRNPVVTDVRRARPAGNLFVQDGRLIRPGQDCSVRYGYAIVLNFVELLTTTEYRERPVGMIQPDWWPGALCTHTMNQTDRIEAVDLKVPVRRAKPRAGFLSASDSVVFAGNKDDLRKVWPHFEIK